MERRRFIEGMIGMALAGPAEAARPRLRLGFLGVAHAHAADKVDIVRASPDWELVGLYAETHALRTGYEAKGLRLMAPEELIAACDVVAVESANADHERHARLALEAGKHVHLEKPPTDNLRGFEELQRIARRKGLRLQVGYMWRHNPGINAALEAARRGWLGHVYLVRATMNTDIGPERRPEWARFAGGVMFELGCHVLDPIVRLLGAPRAVRTTFGTHGGPRDGLADNTAAVLEYPDAIGVVTAATLQPNAFEHRSFEVLGTRGTITVAPIEPPTLRMDLADAAGPYPAGRSAPEVASYRRYADDLTQLAQCVRDEQPLPVTSETELLVHRTVLRACRMST
jgi:predicted dehydrogenase